MSTIKVAIDGPAGAGKSSVSKAVAKKLGFVYIDTGAMYRACALYSIEHNIALNEEFPDNELENIHIDITYRDDGQRIILNGTDVSERIRETDVTKAASDIAKIPKVRLKLVDFQRQLAEKSNVLMDGRDIGTYVLPNAEVKIFLTASVEERARRRFAEMQEKGIPGDLETVKKDIAARDKNDTEREFAPLRQADDAVLLDTTGLSFDEVVDKMCKMISEAK